MIHGFLGLGSNLGDPEYNVLSALYELERVQAFQLHRLSSLYRTKPWGYSSAHDFCNQVLEFGWDGILGELWLEFLQVEENLGKGRRGQSQTDMGVIGQYHDRTIDIDLLDAEGMHPEEVPTSGFQIPHPRAHQRAFVLIPWAELAPGHILSGRPISDWVAELAADDVASVVRLDSEHLPDQFRAHLSHSGN